MTMTDARKNKRKRTIRLAPYMLLIPWFIGISLFRIYPIIMSFYYSLRQFHPVLGDRGFVGLRNYRDILFDSPIISPVFWNSVVATLRYVLLGTPMVLVAAFFYRLHTKL